MFRKIFIIVLPFVIILSLFINHLVYGNSNTTISNVERLEAINYSIEKHKYSRAMAKYMYNRIRYYQEFDNWWDRQNAIWTIYENVELEAKTTIWKFQTVQKQGFKC